MADDGTGQVLINPQTLINPETGNGHFKLDDRDVEFFRRGRQAIQSLNDQMNGVLQYIVSREDLQAKSVKLSDDGTELIIEP
jgi:hypothetical protein